MFGRDIGTKNGKPFDRGMLRVGCFILAGAGVLGCSGSVESEGAEGEGGDTATPGAGGATELAECGKTPVTAPGAIPAIRLTKTEYLNTLAALFPDAKLPALDLPDDDRGRRFNTLADAQTPAPALIERYAATAAQVASVAKASFAQQQECKASASDCVKALLDGVGERAFRRPLTVEERQRYTEAFAKIETAYGKEDAIDVVLRGLLQSPAFLFRSERTIEKDGKLVIDPYDLAARLSYLVWDAPPDDELRALAKSGQLGKASELEKQARRMLEDERAHAAVAAFHRQWLQLYGIGELEKDKASFPKFSRELALSMQQSAEQFAADAFWQGEGALQTLLTSTKRPVDGKLASFYGTANPGSGWQDAELDRSQRAGILTDAGLMASLAHAKLHSPVTRGQFVLQRFLCQSLPPPPPNTPALPDVDISRPTTTRQRFEQTHENGTCGTCHKTLDAVGFPFENYDADGTYRTQENGLPIDTAVMLEGVGDIDGEVANAIELSDKLAHSRQVNACVARQWLGYTQGIDPGDVDACSAAALANALATKQGDVKEMVVALIKSEAFRYAQRSE